MSKLFISYASADRRRVRKIATFLEDNGHQVWWDRELIPGGDFEAEINHQLSEADAIIVCWSKQSIQSNWVKSEANEGMRSDRLIPISIDQSTAPRPFDQLTTLNISNWSDEAGTRLLAAIGDVPSSPSMTVFQKTRQRKHLIAGLGIACAALAITAAWGPIASRLPSPTENVAAAYEKPRISEAATRHLLRRLNDTGRQTSDAAFALIQTGDVHDAIRLLETRYNALSINASKKDEAALLHQIGALAFDYDPAKAHGVYQSLVLLAPDDPLALEQSASLFRERGKIDEAERLFQSALDLPDLPIAQQLDYEIALNQLNHHRGLFAKASSRFDELIDEAKQRKLDNQTARALRQGAMSQFLLYTQDDDQLRLVQAETMLQSALELQISSDLLAEQAASHIALGVVAKATNNFDASQTHYSKAFELSDAVKDPDRTNSALINLGVLAIEQNDFENAEAYYRTALAQNTKHGFFNQQGQIWLQLARLSKARGDRQSIICNNLSRARDPGSSQQLNDNWHNVVEENAKELGCA